MPQQCNRLPHLCTLCNPSYSHSPSKGVGSNFEACINRISYEKPMKEQHAASYCSKLFPREGLAEKNHRNVHLLSTEAKTSISNVKRGSTATTWIVDYKS